MDIPSKDPNDELLDLSTIENKKLVLRLWQPGDKFRPLGMNGNQKISDFLINNKVNIFDKDQQAVLTADDQIIWVCGHRIDDSVRISDRTKNIIRINLSIIWMVLLSLLQFVLLNAIHY